MFCPQVLPITVIATATDEEAGYRGHVTPALIFACSISLGLFVVAES